MVASPSPIPSIKTYWKLTGNLYDMGLFLKIVYSKKFLLTNWMQVFWVSTIVSSFPQSLHVHNDLCQPLLRANCACHRHDVANLSNTPKGKWGYLVEVVQNGQYDTICWEFDLFSESFVSSWMIVWADGVNRCGWCLAGGRECWLEGLHQIPSVSWI